MENFPRKNKSSRYKSLGLFDLLPIVSATLLITTLILVSQEFENSYILTIRRAWIGGTIGLTLFYVFRILLNSERRKSSTYPYRIQNWLFLYGGIGMIQLYPLFDQVHFWWGLSPLVIPLAMLILSFLTQFQADVRRLLLLTLILIGTTTILVPSIQAGFSSAEPYTGSLAKLIRISSDANSDRDELQSFFRKSTELKQPKVLNLCHNPDVFLSPNFAQSASRFFIYWPPFNDIPTINQELSNTHPDVVVTCSQTQVPAAAAGTERSHKQILSRLQVDFESEQELNVNGTIWRIYTR
jgi:hypothetical protein